MSADSIESEGSCPICSVGPSGALWQVERISTHSARGLVPPRRPSRLSPAPPVRPKLVRGTIRGTELLDHCQAEAGPDGATGVFTWQPGVAFLGRYELVFARCQSPSSEADCRRHELRIFLAPKGAGRIGPQVVIDTRRASREVTGAFVLAGWAADPGLDAGTGIDAVHVWAYPVDGRAPTFLGAAAYGGERPDVAAIHGEAVPASD